MKDVSSYENKNFNSFLLDFRTSLRERTDVCRGGGLRA